MLVRSFVCIISLFIAAWPAQANRLVASENGISLFGSYEAQVGRPSAVIERAAVLEKAVKQAFAVKQHTVSTPPQTAWQAWPVLLAHLAHKPLWQQLHYVQQFVNAQSYREDGGHFFSIRDEWQTPQQFFHRGGDCEDYAITKYASLRRLGVPAERLRVTVARNLQQNTHHAFLSVIMDDDILIMDNMLPTVVSHRHIGHYRPVYSLNEHTVWFHWYSGEMPPNIVMLDTIRTSGGAP